MPRLIIFSFFEPNENNLRVYAPRANWPAETFRRMVYGTVVRQRPDGVFGVIDCPDAGQIANQRDPAKDREPKEKEPAVHVSQQPQENAARAGFLELARHRLLR